MRENVGNIQPSAEWGREEISGKGHRKGRDTQQLSYFSLFWKDWLFRIPGSLDPWERVEKGRLAFSVGGSV